ncbi:hypothetical protein BGZ73_006133 [Actinomortierella ambigua]|nr:hypothetical protein BGZ73_006133 [Actinomortierella ambigua]
MDDDSDFHEDLELGIDAADVAPPQADYYDPAYYDSDDDAPTDDSEEEQWLDDDNDEQSASGGKNQRTTRRDPVMEDITKRLKASSVSGTSETVPKKIQRRHRVKSNDELLYDPDQDDLDQEWLHELYPHQFRAMFVENCRTIHNEILRFPKASPIKTKQKRAQRPATASTTNSTTDPSPDTPAATPQFHPDDDSPDVVFHPVVCESCNTKVAVIDSDEIYHFFHVIASDTHPLKS